MKLSKLQCISGYAKQHLYFS